MRTKGEAERQLDELWSRYDGRWRRLLSRHVVRELMLRARFDTDLMAPGDVVNRVSSGLIPDCEQCTNICCAGYENVVSLRLRDIAVLIDVDRTSVISIKKPRFPDSVLAERPNLRTLVDSMLYRTLPVLKQEGPLRRCAALSEDLRCSLHPHWPTSCERFPYSLSAVRREVVWGTRCQSKIMRPEHNARSRELFVAALSAYNERVRDAVLLEHAPDELDRIGIGAFICGPDDDPFESAPTLPILS